MSVSRIFASLGGRGPYSATAVPCAHTPDGSPPSLPLHAASPPPPAPLPPHAAPHSHLTAAASATWMRCCRRPLCLQTCPRACWRGVRTCCSPLVPTTTAPSASRSSPRASCRCGGRGRRLSSCRLPAIPSPLPFPPGTCTGVPCSHPPCHHPVHAHAHTRPRPRTCARSSTSSLRDLQLNPNLASAHTQGGAGVGRRVCQPSALL